MIYNIEWSFYGDGYDVNNLNQICDKTLSLDAISDSLTQTRPPRGHCPNEWKLEEGNSEYSDFISNWFKTETFKTHNTDNGDPHHTDENHDEEKIMMVVTFLFCQWVI